MGRARPRARDAGGRSRAVPGPRRRDAVLGRRSRAQPGGRTRSNPQPCAAPSDHSPRTASTTSPTTPPQACRALVEKSLCRLPPGAKTH